jgi:hypothetical protein
MSHQKYNLEEDIKNCEHIVNKIRNNEFYAQNIYAALCNNQFQKDETIPILTDQVWACSWRYAGGIVADIIGDGTYVDWYCSGMGEKTLTDVSETGIVRKYRPEAYISDEIRKDFKSIGWSQK